MPPYSESKPVRLERIILGSARMVANYFESVRAPEAPRHRAIAKQLAQKHMENMRQVKTK